MVKLSYFTMLICLWSKLGADLYAKFSLFFVTFIFFPGKRVCPGEALAKMEIFLFVTCIVRRYKILLGQETTPSTKGQEGLTYIPVERYKVRFVERD